MHSQYRPSALCFEIGILVVKIDGRAAVRLGRRLECWLRQHCIRQCQQDGKAADEYGACGSAVRLLCAGEHGGESLPAWPCPPRRETGPWTAAAPAAVCSLASSRRGWRADRLCVPAHSASVQSHGRTLSSSVCSKSFCSRYTIGFHQKMMQYSVTSSLTAVSWLRKCVYSCSRM